MKFQPPSEAELQRMKARRTTESGVDYDAARSAAMTPRGDVLSHVRGGGSTFEAGGTVSRAVEAQIVTPKDDLGGQGPALPEQFVAPEDAPAPGLAQLKIDAAAEALAMAHERLRAKGLHPNSPACTKVAAAYKGLTGKGL